jgi:hypothetical protein
LLKRQDISVLYNILKELIMLKDRKALLEHELKKAHSEAANMYLSLAIGGGDVHSKEYQDLKEKISNLNFDLQTINTLLTQGHQ